MPKKRSKKASVLILTVLITAAASSILGSIMRLGATEARMNDRHITRLEATNAAESILQYGIVELVTRWKDTSYLTNDSLSTVNQPLQIPSRFKSLYYGNHQRTDFSSAQVQGGKLSDPTWTFVDPVDPANQYDQEKGQRLLVRTVNILSKSASFTSAESDKVNVYAKTTLTLRDVPLLSYAVFYNMDMEFHPGPLMDIYGPVHSNGKIWADAVNDLYFHSSVTTADEYRYGKADGHTESNHSGNTWIKNAVGDWINNYKGSGDKQDRNSYYDSLNANWNQIAMNLWNGNLLTNTHGVQKRNLMGQADYVRDNPDTPSLLDDALNNGYALIEPNFGPNHPGYKGKAGEKSKYANKAGLIVRVHEGNSSDPGSYQLSSNYYVTLHKLERSDPLNPLSEPALDGDGNVIEKSVKLDPSLVSKVFNFEEYKEDSRGNPTSGFWDGRRNKGLSYLEFDIKKFRKAVDDSYNKYDPGKWTNYSPSSDYNGIVYTEFPESGPSGRPDNIYLSKESLGLKVVNGDVLPNPNYNNERGPGFSLATNNVMYVQGNFNADGKQDTGSANTGDDPSNPAPPSALAADSITLLSGKWDDNNSKKSKSSRAAEFTEVDAALIAGITPTAKEGAPIISGGVHNFPKMLENWSSIALRYRGSMVCVYENEIATEGVNGSYYSPPIRDWGFSPQFAKGVFPPGTPTSRSFRAIDYTILSQNEFETEYNTMQSDLNNTSV